MDDDIAQLIYLSAMQVEFMRVLAISISKSFPLGGKIRYYQNLQCSVICLAMQVNWRCLCKCCCAMKTERLFLNTWIDFSRPKRSFFVIDDSDKINVVCVSND